VSATLASANGIAWICWTAGGPAGGAVVGGAVVVVSW